MNVETFLANNQVFTIEEMRSALAMSENSTAIPASHIFRVSKIFLS